MIARIYSINMSWKDNYASFDDSDSMSDYSHGFSAGINRIVEWVKKEGSRQITVTVTNNDPEIPALKRVQQIAKAAGYAIEDKSGEKTWLDWQNKPVKYFHYEWLLTAKPERIAVIEAEDKEEERKRLEAEAYAKTPQARITKIKCAIHQAEAVTAVFDARGFHMITQEERAQQLSELNKELAAVESELNANTASR